MSVNMTKGQRISLEKQGGGELTRVRMGLGWDAIEKKGLFGRKKAKDIDLDASCVVLDEARNELDAVWFKKLRSSDGSIVHTGDNLTGEGEGDDESIIVELDSSPTASRRSSSPSPPTAPRASPRSPTRPAGSSTSARAPRSPASTCPPPARTRDDHGHRLPPGGGWKMAAIGDTGKGKTYKDMTEMIRNVS